MSWFSRPCVTSQIVAYMLSQFSFKSYASLADFLKEICAFSWSNSYNVRSCYRKKKNSPFLKKSYRPKLIGEELFWLVQATRHKMWENAACQGLHAHSTWVASILAATTHPAQMSSMSCSISGVPTGNQIKKHQAHNNSCSEPFAVSIFTHSY